MKFEEFYEIKFGMPVGKLPTFAYRVMTEFGTYGPEKFGSIRPTQPVEVYDMNFVARLLETYIKNNVEKGAYDISAEVLLDKDLSLDAIDDYIRNVRPMVTIDTGVMLSREHGPAGLYTISAYHRPEEGDEVYAFASDIEGLRRQKEVVNIVHEPGVTGGRWEGPLTSLSDLQNKYPHRFQKVEEKDEDADLEIVDYLARIQHISKSGMSHIREIKWVKKGLDLTLGNCHVTFRQRPKSIKMEAHANSVDGAPLHNVATSERTITEAITDFMAYEVHCAQISFGHYDRNKRIQYNCREMMNWMKMLAKKYGLRYTEDANADSLRHDVDEYAEISWQDGTPAILMNIKFLHAEFEFDHVDGNPQHMIATYHNTCEKDAKTSMEMWLAEAYRKAVNGE